MRITVWFILGIIVLISANLWVKKSNRSWNPPGCFDDLMLIRWFFIILFWPIALLAVLSVSIAEHYEKRLVKEKK